MKFLGLKFLPLEKVDFDESLYYVTIQKLVFEHMNVPLTTVFQGDYSLPTRPNV